MDISLTGKRALVCGSSQGIGRAAAIELARLGASVTLMARNESALASVAAELVAAGGRDHGYQVADFHDVEQVRREISRFVAAGNVAHILVNNTGGPPGGTAIDARVEEYLQAFRSHVVCNQILVQAVVSGMKHAGYGRIVNIVSTSVKQPIVGLGVSNTIRAAVAGWAKTLAHELGPFGITVNNVLPGYTNTSRLSALIAVRAQKAGVREEEIAAQWRAEVPAGRFADPSEIGAAVAFLASPAAAYINGINLPVDGGRTSCL
jgi:3-oxoacyl-[acyl-carrier protein] reductase